MIKNQRWHLPALLLAGGLAFASCSEPDSIGIEVQPTGIQPGVFFTDTVTVTAETVREDTLRSDDGVAAFNLLGSYTDPVFGFVNASIYSQVRLPNNNTNFSFGTDPLLDSVVLTMAYIDSYGDTLTPLSVDVYKLNETMYLDSNYYTNDVIQQGDPIGVNIMVDPHPKDSVVIDGITRAPHMRLRLDDTFGAGFIQSGDANFLTNADFINYFKGIYIHVDDVTGSGQGSILTMNIQATISKLSFYYRNGTDTTHRTANFEINGDCPRFTHYDHDYSTSTFGNVFPVSGDNNLYVQSMAGVKVRLKFPYINNFTSDGPVSINKAELVVPIETNSTYANHQSMLVFGVDSGGGEAIIPDILESSSYYGGTYNLTSESYNINLARYVQRLVSGNIANDYGLSLISAGGAQNAFRTVIPGTATTGSKIQLRITYSKLN